MKLGRLSALFGAVAVALAVGLAMPAGTAEAAEASQTTVTAVTPGTDDTVGTSMVPGSFLVDGAGAATGMVNDALGQLLWSGGGDVAQSIQTTAFESLTTSGKVTNTGLGFTVGDAYYPFCAVTYTVPDGAVWGDSVPYQWTSTDRSSLAGVDQAFCQSSGKTNMFVTCYNSAATATDNPWSSTVASRAAGPWVSPCANLGTTWRPVAARVDPSQAGNNTVGTDGGWWVNPTYAELFASGVSMRTTKTCLNPATSTTSTVTKTGLPGTGTVPNVMCPAGTYPTTQKVEALGPSGAVLALLMSQSLAPSIFDQYGNCLGPQLACDLSVWIDGVRCAYLLQDCGTWADIQQTQPDRISCHWGGYVLPSTDDCNVLKNCYGVPIDGITNPVAGDPTQCGIDPGGTSGEPLEPLQAGKFKCTSGCPADPSPSAGPTGPTGPAGSDGTDGTDGSDGADGKDGSTPTVVVSPTIVVNVPQPTVNVTVNAPGPGDVDVPDGDCSPMYPTGKAKFNPMDWGYKPTRCALEKLFVPAPGHLAELQGEAGNGVTDAFGTWTTPITNIAGAFNVSASAGCMGPPVNLGFPFNKTIYPANACSEPAASIAAVCRLGCQAGLLIGGFSAGAFSILQGFGINFRTFTVRSEVAARMAEKDAKKSG